jgi:hypothetical protein
MHISCGIYIQTIRDIIKELKQLISDMFLYRYLIYNDREQTLNGLPKSHEINVILSLSKSLNVKFEKLIIHTLKHKK